MNYGTECRTTLRERATPERRFSASLRTGGPGGGYGRRTKSSSAVSPPPVYFPAVSPAASRQIAGGGTGLLFDTPKKPKRPDAGSKHPSAGPCGYLAPFSYSYGPGSCWYRYIDTSIHIFVGLSRSFLGHGPIFRKVFGYRGMGRWGTWGMRFANIEY